MRLPPPAPRTPEELAREALVRELRALETPELLALCLRVKGHVARLRQYLGILRGRAGNRAQLAACLVCFDMARAGDEVAQREFLALAPNIETLAHDARLVGELLAGDAYLEQTWRACLAALAAEDQRALADGGMEGEDVDLAGELDLLSDVELDIDLDAAPAQDPARLARAHEEFSGILARHLAQNVEKGTFSDGGFETGDSKDVDRLQWFLDQAISYSDLVTTARGLASLGHLFLATHLRLKTLFGKRNARRAHAVKTGLARLPADAEAMEQAAAVFELQGSEALGGFEKVLELLMDYLVFCNQQRLDPRAAATVDAYVEADRQPPPVLLTGDNRRRRA